MTLPTFLLTIKLDTCAKFHDYRSNNDNVIMDEEGASWLGVQEKPKSNRVKKVSSSASTIVTA